MKTLISLFDYTGNWSKPFEEAGWNVIRHDLKTGEDIFRDSIPAAVADNVEFGPYAEGLIAAVPCTDFAGSGARWWKEKDTAAAPYPENKDIDFDNRLDFFTFMVHCTLYIKDLLLKPGGFWSIENPVGRIHKLVPELGKPLMYFNPCDFGDPYTKKTALYGNFNTNLQKTWVLPLEGSKMHSQYGGKSERTKALRSVTPKGFAKAFFEANKNVKTNHQTILNNEKL